MGGARGKLPAGAGDGRAQVPSLGREDPLQEGMAAPSSTLAWRIPVNTGAWRATVHTVAESRTRLTQFSTGRRVAGVKGRDDGGVVVMRRVRDAQILSYFEGRANRSC